MQTATKKSSKEMTLEESTHLLQDNKAEFNSQSFSPRETLRQKIENEKKDKSKRVRAIFQNPKRPDDVIKFPFRRYKGPIEKYEFKHGEEYTVPMYIVDHINYDVGEQRYDGLVDAKGQLIPKGKKLMRFGFSIVGYVD